jgi:hypothetical protein
LRTRYAAETFSEYSLPAPAVFLFAGIRNEALGSGAEHHNGRFDLDEDALPYAVGAMVRFAVNQLPVGFRNEQTAFRQSAGHDFSLPSGCPKLPFIHIFPSFAQRKRGEPDPKKHPATKGA